MCTIHPPDPNDIPMHHLPRNIYAAQPEVTPLTTEEYTEKHFIDYAADPHAEEFPPVKYPPVTPTNPLGEGPPYTLTCPHCRERFTAYPGAIHRCPMLRSACDFPVISAQDADVLSDVRRELERARELYPPFRSLASAVVEIQHRTDALGCRLMVSCGQMDSEVKRKLEQTAAICLRTLTENAR